MSADNGIYILWTPTALPDVYEFRPRHLQAVENVDWDDSIHEYTTDEEIRIKNAREMWKEAPVFTSRLEALDVAADMLAEQPICEYGISFVHINRPFAL